MIARGALAMAALAALAGAADAAPLPPKAKTASTEPLREAPEALLARAKVDYAHSEYDRVVLGVRPLLYPDVLLAPDDELTEHKLLALSHFFRREVTDAEKEFETVLQLKEDFTLDPLYEPQTAIAFLDGIRRRNREKLDAMAAEKKREEERHLREEELRRRAEEERKRSAATPTVIERSVKRNHLVINFIPFGAGQFQNGEPRLGWALLSTEALLGAASLGMWASLQFKYYLPSKPVPQSERTLAIGLNVAAVVTGAVFWAEVVVGVIEALARYRPQVVTERKLRGGKPLTLAPYVVGEGGGGMLIRGAF